MVADGRQLLRVDQELPAVLSAAAEEELVAAGLAALETADVLLLSDYSKGTLTPRVMETLLGEARRRGVPALVDPKGKDYSRYRGATCITPNRKELETVTGESARDLGTVARLASRLRDDLGLDAHPREALGGGDAPPVRRGASRSGSRRGPARSST